MGKLFKGTALIVLLNILALLRNTTILEADLVASDSKSYPWGQIWQLPILETVVGVIIDRIPV